MEENSFSTLFESNLLGLWVGGGCQDHMALGNKRIGNKRIRIIIANIYGVLTICQMLC